MLSFDGGAEMYFGGRGDEPMAYIELSLFGTIPVQIGRASCRERV